MLLSLLGFAAESFALDIFAQRGASHDAPENTLAELRAQRAPSFQSVLSPRT